MTDLVFERPAWKAACGPGHWRTISYKEESYRATHWTTATQMEFGLLCYDRIAPSLCLTWFGSCMPASLGWQEGGAVSSGWIDCEMRVRDGEAGGPRHLQLRFSMWIDIFVPGAKQRHESCR